VVHALAVRLRVAPQLVRGRTLLGRLRVVAIAGVRHAQRGVVVVVVVDDVVVPLVSPEVAGALAVVLVSAGGVPGMVPVALVVVVVDVVSLIVDVDVGAVEVVVVVEPGVALAPELL
jgi:hypothetical protein